MIITDETTPLLNRTLPDAVTLFSNNSQETTRSYSETNKSLTCWQIRRGKKGLAQVKKQMFFFEPLEECTNNF